MSERHEFGVEYASGVNFCQDCGALTSGTNLCGPCIGRLEGALGELPGLFADLGRVAARQDRRYRGTGRPREDEDWRGDTLALIRTPWPVDVDAVAELDRVAGELAGWVNHLCAAQHACAYGPGGRVPLAHWLLAHLERISADEAAGEILTELEALRADLRHAVDNSSELFYAGPCHAAVDEPVIRERAGVLSIRLARRRCERDLYARVNPWKGADSARTIVCRGLRSDEDGCGTVHTIAARQSWLLDSIEDALLPLEVWRRALPRMLDSLIWPHRSTWVAWADPARRKRLRARSLDGAGRELFRGGDLLELVRADQARIRQRMSHAALDVKGA